MAHAPDLRWVWIGSAMATMALQSGCASAPAPTPAPIEVRTERGPRAASRTVAPVVAPKASVRAAAPAPAPVEEPPAPRSRPPAPPPDWAAGPGRPLSDYALRPEEAQPFDPGATPKSVIVQPGDTAFAISTRYQIPLRALIDANALEAPFALVAGSALTLPPPRTVRAAPGDTLDSLAERYAIDARSLAYLNRMSPDATVRAGQRLVLPALARPRIRAPEPVIQEPERGAPRVRFAWPAKGKLLARFGPRPDGKRSDGIDIDVAQGAPVRAAAQGTVVYAGNDLPGYGNLVLVKHDGGWVTAYARTRRILAREGAKVAQGDVIAEAGGPVHFQVRRGAEPADPLGALPPV